jgi:hypothetical protein
MQGAQFVQRGVLGGVVDEDHLERTPGEGGGDLARQRARGPLFVMDGDDDGDVGSGFGHGCSTSRFLGRTGERPSTRMTAPERPC